MSIHETNRGSNKMIFSKQDLNTNLFSIVIISIIAVFATNSFAAVSLEQGDTMYYFAKKCSYKGKTSYALMSSGQWSAYDADDVYQEYKYMKDMIEIELKLSGGQSNVTAKQLFEQLDKTRDKRLKAAKTYLTCR